VDPLKAEILATPHLQDLVKKIKKREASGPWLFKKEQFFLTA
jgi:hypothetical protein